MTAHRAAPWSAGDPALVAAVALLSACANPQAELAVQAQHALLGLSEAELLSCAGVPERREQRDGLALLTYVSRRLAGVPHTEFGYWGTGAWAPGWPWWGPDAFVGPAFPVTTYSWYAIACTVTFTLRDGVVERVVYGADGSTYPAACFPVVRSCLPAGTSGLSAD